MDRAKKESELTAIAWASNNFVTARELLWKMVGEAREAGVSWDDIAKPLQCSRQAAQKRFQKPPPGHLI